MKARKRAAPRCRAKRAPLRGRRAPLRGPRMRRKKKPTGQRKRRMKAPVIPLTARGSPPSYFKLLQEAVLTLKEARNGASLPAIRRQLQKRYKGRFDKAGNKLLTTALERLAERGKVISKQGYRYRFNAPKVSKSKAPGKGTNGQSASSSAYSGATRGSAPSESDATAGSSGDDSRSSTSSSTSSGANRSGKSAKDGDAPKDEVAVPKDSEAPGNNVDGEGKSSTGDDLSSSASASSSTASRRAPSSKTR